MASNIIYEGTANIKLPLKISESARVRRTLKLPSVCVCLCVCSMSLHICCAYTYLSMWSASVVKTEHSTQLLPCSWRHHPMWLNNILISDVGNKTSTCVGAPVHVEVNIRLDHLIHSVRMWRPTQQPRVSILPLTVNTSPPLNKKRDHDLDGRQIL